MLFGTYDPTSNALQIGPIQVVGFAEGTFITAKRNEKGYSLKMGSDGKGTRVKNGNRSGTIEFVLDQSSPSNDQLQALAQGDEDAGTGVGPGSVSDKSSKAGKVFAQNCWIQGQPDWERAKELSTVTWVVETELLKIVHSGTIPIPGTI